MEHVTNLSWGIRRGPSLFDVGDVPVDEVEWTWLGRSSALRFFSKAIHGNI
jgi:hypothetical protein